MPCLLYTQADSPYSLGCLHLLKSDCGPDHDHLRLLSISSMALVNRVRAFAGPTASRSTRVCRLYGFTGRRSVMARAADIPDAMKEQMAKAMQVG